MSSRNGSNNILPFVKSGNGTYSFHSAPPGERQLNDAATLYIAAIPSMMTFGGRHGDTVPRACSIVNNTASYAEKVSQLVAPDSTFLRCDVYNATYHTEFTYINGDQEVRIHARQADTRPLRTVSEVSVLCAYQFPNATETAYPPPGVPVCNRLVANVSALSCDFDASILGRLSYQGVVDALSKLLVGTISWDGNIWPFNPNGILYINDFEASLKATTAVIGTPLTKTRELSFLTK